MAILLKYVIIIIIIIIIKRTIGEAKKKVERTLSKGLN